MRPASPLTSRSVAESVPVASASGSKPPALQAPRPGQAEWQFVWESGVQALLRSPSRSARQAWLDLPALGSALLGSLLPSAKLYSCCAARRAAPLAPPPPAQVGRGPAPRPEPGGLWRPLGEPQTRAAGRTEKAPRLPGEGADAPDWAQWPRCAARSAVLGLQGQGLRRRT